MILVIDNYDSFTWNLVHYLMELGVEVRVERNDAMTAAQAIASNAQGFLISPGPCTPTEAGISLDLVAGPRDDWFDLGWRSVLTEQVHHVTPDSDRVGVRTVAEQPLVRSVHRELPSEGVETGSLQVPPEGHPVLFLADHPVTGGYPVVGVLTPASVDRAAQLRSGDAIRFRIVR